MQKKGDETSETLMYEGEPMRESGEGMPRNKRPHDRPSYEK